MFKIHVTINNIMITMYYHFVIIMILRVVWLH